MVSPYSSSNINPTHKSSSPSPSISPFLLYKTNSFYGSSVSISDSPANAIPLVNITSKSTVIANVIFYIFTHVYPTSLSSHLIYKISLQMSNMPKPPQIYNLFINNTPIFKTSSFQVTYNFTTISLLNFYISRQKQEIS